VGRKRPSSISETVGLATHLAEAVRATDDFVASAMSPIQCRDHVRDMSLIVTVIWSRGIERRPADEAFRTLAAFMGDAAPDLLVIPRWLTAMSWIGCEHELRIDQSFASQLTERHGADDLDEAAYRWLTTDDPGVTS